MAEPPPATILVIDDDHNGRDSLCELLQLRGYSAVGVRHGREALDRLDGGLRPRLMILDLDMPIMTGAELLVLLVEHPIYSSIPVVIVSAAPPAPETTGYVHFLRKPAAWQELLAIVRRFV